MRYRPPTTSERGLNCLLQEHAPATILDVRLPGLKVGYEDDGPFFPDAEATALRFAAERCRLHAELAPGLNRTKVWHTMEYYVYGGHSVADGVRHSGFHYSPAAEDRKPV